MRKPAPRLPTTCTRFRSCWIDYPTLCQGSIYHYGSFYANLLDPEPLEVFGKNLVHYYWKWLKKMMNPNQKLQNTLK